MIGMPVRTKAGINFAHKTDLAGLLRTGITLGVTMGAVAIATGTLFNALKGAKRE